jgi:3-methyladenine DNA glycosylase Tag
MAGKADEPYKSGMTSAQIQSLLHDPNLVRHLQQIASMGAAEANDLAVIPEAEYDTVTQNNPNTRRGTDGLR